MRSTFNGSASFAFTVLALATIAATLFGGGSVALAQAVPSSCMAIARNMPGGLSPTYVSFDGKRISSSTGALRRAERSDGGPRDRLAQASRENVRITYIRHSTYRIESPAGVVVATDYAGYAGDVTPDIVTMNHAHSSHWTANPDPAIGHVLRGWNPEGGPAEHALTVEDVYVRNVPTDIRSYGGTMEPDGNSIFIFEIAGLCIGHLGHLHQELTDEDYAKIGRLDIVMVPVDGGYTMSQAGIGKIAERLHSSIVLPMHRFRGPIERFLSQLPDFAVERRDEPSLTVSVRTLPKSPTVIILSGV